MKSSRWIAPILGLVIALAIALLTFRALGNQPKAPSFSYTLLNGKTASSSQWQGKVMLVNFWATSCTSCVAEMPELVALHEKFKSRGFDTLAVAMSYDPPAYVANFVSSRQLPFSVTWDGQGEIARQFDDVKLTPTLVLIDQHGAIIKRYVGPPDFAALHTLVEQLLRKV